MWASSVISLLSILFYLICAPRPISPSPSYIRQSFEQIKIFQRSPTLPLFLFRYSRPSNLKLSPEFFLRLTWSIQAPFNSATSIPALRCHATAIYIRHTHKGKFDAVVSGCPVSIWFPSLRNACNYGTGWGRCFPDARRFVSQPGSSYYFKYRGSPTCSRYDNYYASHIATITQILSGRNSGDFFKLILNLIGTPE